MRVPRRPPSLACCLLGCYCGYCLPVHPFSYPVLSWHQMDTRQVGLSGWGRSAGTASRTLSLLLLQTGGPEGDSDTSVLSGEATSGWVVAAAAKAALSWHPLLLAWPELLTPEHLLPPRAHPGEVLMGQGLGAASHSSAFHDGLTSPMASKVTQLTENEGRAPSLVPPPWQPGSGPSLQARPSSPGSISSSVNCARDPGPGAVCPPNCVPSCIGENWAVSTWPLHHQFSACPAPRASSLGLIMGLPAAAVLTGLSLASSASGALTPAARRCQIQFAP